MIRTKPQLPIGSKLALIQGLLLAVVVGISALAFMTLDRLAGSAERVAQRYAPQLDLISDVQMLMFRISLEARHAMLVETDEERQETFQRIGAFREDMLAKLKTFESNLTTAQGKANFEKIRAADTDFWRLGGGSSGQGQGWRSGCSLHATQDRVGSGSRPHGPAHRRSTHLAAKPGAVDC